MLKIKSEELEVIDEDPVERAKRIADMTNWIKTGCLLIIAIVCIGAGLIYLEFVLVPLVLARFCVYLFQPFINYMVGKKPIGGIRLRIPRAIAITICFIFVIFLFILLGIAIYFSGSFLFPLFLILFLNLILIFQSSINFERLG